MKYETLEEAISIANSTRYGLGASVFGPDQEQCVEKVAKHLQCGMVSINDFAVFYVSDVLQNQTAYPNQARCPLAKVRLFSIARESMSFD